MHEREGMTLNTALFLIFLVLKLTENITWSWLWVLSPLWIPFAIIFILIIIVLIITTIEEILRKLKEGK